MADNKDYYGSGKKMKGQRLDKNARQLSAVMIPDA
jgi:hypothetical protein